ncbi:hypothetical protein ACFV7R_05265 [Streptomyces sp. NPDC059866]|uniref:hypothetical protein n=1 Tax=Streptomyces sp. NPDC059866 TaxID=3346978 RepID=UPI00366556BA
MITSHRRSSAAQGWTREQSRVAPWATHDLGQRGDRGHLLQGLFAEGVGIGVVGVAVPCEGGGVEEFPYQDTSPPRAAVPSGT